MSTFTPDGFLGNSKRGTFAGGDFVDHSPGKRSPLIFQEHHLSPKSTKDANHLIVNIHAFIA